MRLLKGLLVALGILCLGDGLIAVFGHASDLGIASQYFDIPVAGMFAICAALWIQLLVVSWPQEERLSCLLSGLGFVFASIVCIMPVASVTRVKFDFPTTIEGMFLTLFSLMLLGDIVRQSRKIEKQPTEGGTDVIC